MAILVVAFGFAVGALGARTRRSRLYGWFYRQPSLRHPVGLKRPAGIIFQTIFFAKTVRSGRGLCSLEIRALEWLVPGPGQSRS